MRFKPSWAFGVYTQTRKEIIIFQSNSAAFGIVAVDTDIVSHGKGRVFREDGSARIALFLGIGPVALISGQIQLYLSLLQLSLLQAEEIRAERPEDILEALLHSSPQAVYIPRYESHSCFFLLSNAAVLSR